MAAHTYWRLYIGAKSNVYAQIGIVSFLDAAQVNQSTGGIATASSEYSGSWAAGNAFDGNPTSEWASAGVPGSEWIAYQHPSPVDIVFVGVKVAAPYPISGLALQYSDDGVSWSAASPLYLLAGQPALTSGSYTVLGMSTSRRPLVVVNGQLKELPDGDTLPPQAPSAHVHATSDVTGLDDALAGKEPSVSAGTTAQYWRGDKTWRDFFTDVRAATLTGLSTATNAAITADDTVLVAQGKLQAQVGAKANATEVREKLTAARTYYVRTDGSDSNTGLANTSGGAFLTVQKAIDTVVAALDLGIYDVTIHVGTGTWTVSSTLKTLVGAGKCVIRGINADTTSTVISTTSAPCFAGTYVGTYQLEYLKLQNATAGNCLQVVGSGAVLRYQNVNFGSSPGNHVYSGSGAYVVAVGHYAISGGANAHVAAVDVASASIGGSVTVTLTGTPAFPGGFLYAGRASSVLAASVVFSGSATGKRYVADSNGVITTLGGATYLPGDAAGTTATGGVYQ